MTDDDIDRAVLRSAASWLASLARTLPGTERRAGAGVTALADLLWQLAAVAAMAGQGHGCELLWLARVVQGAIDRREGRRRRKLSVRVLTEKELEWRRTYMRDYRARQREANNTH